MLSLRIGVRLTDLRQPTKKALHTASGLGAEAVEIDARRTFRPSAMTQSAIRHLRKTLEDLGLGVAALAYPTRRGYEVIDDLEPRLEGTRAAMRLAYQLGTPHVVNHIGNIPDAETDPEAWNTLVQSLAELARFGQREGAWLTGLTGSAPLDAVVRLREHLPQGGLALAVDAGELVMHRIDPADFVRRLGADVRYAYLSDGVRDASRGRGMSVPIGRGAVDFPSLLGALEERGYHGYLTIRTSGSDTPTVEIEHAMEYVEALFQ